MKEPEVGLFLKEAEQDKDFYVVIADGREWVTNKKFIKRLRKDYVG